MKTPIIEEDSKVCAMVQTYPKSRCWKLLQNVTLAEEVTSKAEESLTVMM
jgi:hypothetical protein